MVYGILIDYRQENTSYLQITRQVKIGGSMPISADTMRNNCIEKITTARGNIYGLHKAVFKGMKVQTVFVCDKHGDFLMLPSSLVNGALCPVCQKEKDSSDYVKEFIAKATEKHNGKYGYDRLNFKSTREPITITCPIHGDMEMAVSTHLTGLGCPLCSREKAKETRTSTTEEFIEKAKEVHGDEYDYSKAVYTGYHDNVIIICPKHGEFQQTPGNHMHGSKCPKCNDESKFLTTEEFIRRSREIHGNKYDYSKVVYVRHDDKVIINCPEHGEFSQTPSAHINGNQGCPTCWEGRRGKARKVSLEDFIIRADEMHDDKYDYSKVTIGDTLNEPITIICPEHGEFTQTAERHLAGDGCAKCAGKYKRTTEEYIHDAKKVHGERYGYDRTVYVNNTTPVLIKCPHHGYVSVNPRTHLIGPGCTQCTVTTGELKVADWLKEKDLDYIKEYSIKGYRYRYDFYIPMLKLLIEYDGAQHYMPIGYFGGQRTLVKIQENDKIKNELARNYGLFMIRIPYTKHSVLEDYLLFMVSRIYRYAVNGTYYRNFLELCRALNLPGSTSAADVEHYLVYKQ